MNKTQADLNDRFRQRASNARADLGRVERQVGPDLKRLLGTARHLLSDVDLLFLDPKIIAEPRTDQQLSHWLASGGALIGGAEKVIAEIARWLPDFRPNARVIG